MVCTCGPSSTQLSVSRKRQLPPTLLTQSWVPKVRELPGLEVRIKWVSLSSVANPTNEVEKIPSQSSYSFHTKK